MAGTTSTPLVTLTDALDTVATVCTLNIKCALNRIRAGRPEAAIRPLETALRVTAETARDALAAASPVAPQAAPAPIHVEAVAEVRRDDDGGVSVRWLVEGPDPDMHGALLLLASEPITDDDGSGEVYRAAPVAQPLTPLTDEQINGIRAAAMSVALSRPLDGVPDGVRYAEAFARAIERAHGITAAGKEGGS
jgi:hypothetical protein